MSVVGYPQPGKEKSRLILEAFTTGAGGRLADPQGGLRPGAAAFFGTAGLEALFYLAKAARTWYYLDNAFFDCARGSHYRVCPNALQRAGWPDYARLARLGIRIKPWRRTGSHILIVEQSDYFMRTLTPYPGGRAGWLDDVRRTLARYTDRELRVRPWQRDKLKAGRSLPADLDGAWALVTATSAAANEALIAGIPVFASPGCAAGPFANIDFSTIESPAMPDRDREEWAAALAGAQWTMEELRDGTAWRALQALEETAP